MHSEQTSVVLEEVGTALTHRSVEDSSQALAISPLAGSWHSERCIVLFLRQKNLDRTCQGSTALGVQSFIWMESTRTAGLNFILCLFFSSSSQRSAPFLDSWIIRCERLYNLGCQQIPGCLQTPCSKRWSFC